jgi:hypothetical protein
MINLLFALFLNVSYADEVKVISKNVRIIAVCRIDYGEKGTYPTITRVIKYNKNFLWGTADGTQLQRPMPDQTVYKVPLEDCRVVNKYSMLGVAK